VFLLHYTRRDRKTHAYFSTFAREEKNSARL